MLPWSLRPSTVTIAPMNSRERLRAIVEQRPVDRGISWPETTWPETRERWLAEGMTGHEQLGFDSCDFRPSVEIGYVPAWETGTICDEGIHELIRGERPGRGDPCRSHQGSRKSSGLSE